MRQARWIGLIFVVLLGVPVGVQIYRDVRYCQFTAEGNRWREQQQKRTGVDPCTVDRPLSVWEHGAAVGFGLAVALTVVGFVSYEIRRRRVEEVAS